MGYGLVKHSYPFDDSQPFYLELPDRWLGSHARRRDEALDLAEKGNLPPTLKNFAVAMALLDDWHLPALPKNPKMWVLDEVELRLIGWVTQTVLPAFYENFIVSRN